MDVSSKFWVFPAIAVPLTALVLSIWMWWFRSRLRKDRLAIHRSKRAIDPLGIMEEGSTRETEDGIELERNGDSRY